MIAASSSTCNQQQPLAPREHARAYTDAKYALC